MYGATLLGFSGPWDINQQELQKSMPSIIANRLNMWNIEIKLGVIVDEVATEQYPKNIVKQM